MDARNDDSAALQAQERPPGPQDATALARIQARTRDILRRHLPAEQPVALVDFPRHQNAGDSLIWQGEREHLRRMGVEVRYVASLFQFSPGQLRRRVPQGPILLSGGGNFGDRWPHHQALRERVVEAFPDRPVVQLPQTIEFRDPENHRRCRRIFSRHPDLTLLMRETRQVGMVQELFPDNTVAFCPDAALGAGPLSPVDRPVHDLVLLLRTDSESRRLEFPQLDGLRTAREDWGLTGPAASAAWRALRLPEDLSRIVPALHRPLQPVIERSFEAMADLNVAAAVRILSRGRVVITDRLHAMVLAALLGIPVVVLDNANGKVRALFDDYVHELPRVEFADDPHEAVARAVPLLDVRRDAVA